MAKLTEREVLELHRGKLEARIGKLNTKADAVKSQDFITYLTSLQVELAETQLKLSKLGA